MTKASNTKRIWLAAAVALLVVGLGCSTKSPTAPQQTPAPPGGTDVSASWDITVEVSPSEIAQGATEPARVSVRVRKSSDNTPPPQGTTIVLSTSLGEFVSLASGLTSIALSTTNGRAETLFFPGTIEGTAVITAQLEASAGQTGVRIREGVVAAFESVNGEVNLSIQFINRSTGDPRRFFWEFGDGSTSREENPAHLYPEPGDYVVRLRVEKGTFSDQVTTPVFVVEPLFITDVNPNQGGTGTHVQVRGQGFVRPLRVRFDDVTADVTFVSSDRTRLSTIVPSFNAESFIMETCRAIDPTTGMETEGMIAAPTRFDFTVERIPVSPGNTSDTLIQAFTVLPDDPVCELPLPGPVEANFTFVCAGVDCAFTDTSTGGPVAWSWTFGDGTGSTLQNPTHSYAGLGSYLATLTVTYFDGSTLSVSMSVDIT